MKRIFTYGTLKQGFHNHYLLKSSKFIGKEELKGYTLFDLNFQYPLAVKMKDKSITGEIYEVDEKTFGKLLQIEISVGYNIEFDTNKKVYVFYYSEDMLKCKSQTYQRQVKDIGSTWKER